MAAKVIKVTGYNELLAKCDFDVLVQPEMEAVRDSIVKRVLRQGKGLGAQRNKLTVQAKPLGATVTTTRIFPRTKGTAWGRKNEKVVPAVARNAMAKAVRNIEARWAGGA